MNSAAPSVDWMALLAVAMSVVVMIYLFRRFASGMNQQDWILLRKARSQGVNTAVPQSVDFVLFLATEEAGNAVLEDLRTDGFEVSMRQAQLQYARNPRKPGTPQAGYLVTAKRSLLLVPAELTRLRTQLNAVAAAQQGIYCGWQVSGSAPLPQSEVPRRA